jgi:hypothetical protein
MFRTPESKKNRVFPQVKSKEISKSGSNNVFAYADFDQPNTIPRTPEHFKIPFNIPKSPDHATFLSGASNQVVFSPEFTKKLVVYRENMRKRSSEHQTSRNANAKVRVDGFSSDEDDDQ